MMIHIEIKKSEYKEGCFDYRIGDIEGAMTCSNSSREEMMKDIEDEIDKLGE